MRSGARRAERRRRIQALEMSSVWVQRIACRPSICCRLGRPTMLGTRAGQSRLASGQISVIALMITRPRRSRSRVTTIATITSQKPSPTLLSPPSNPSQWSGERDGAPPPDHGLGGLEECRGPVARVSQCGICRCTPASSPQKTFPDPATETPRASPAIVYSESSPEGTSKCSRHDCESHWVHAWA